jgi:hypothetical protein
LPITFAAMPYPSMYRSENNLYIFIVLTMKAVFWGG